MGDIHNRQRFLIALGTLSLSACGAAASPMLRKSAGDSISPMASCNPITGVCTAPSPSPPPNIVSITQGDAYGTAYEDSNYATLYVSGTYTSRNAVSANTDGSMPYSYVSQRGFGTASGTYPALSSIPWDVDWEYNGSTLHHNSSTGQVTVNILNSGQFSTIYVDPNFNLIIEYPNQPTSVTPLSHLGYSTMMSHACMVAIADATAISLIGALAALAVLAAGCGDGPAAAFTCAAATIVATAILDRASKAAKGVVQTYCGGGV